MSTRNDMIMKGIDCATALTSIKAQTFYNQGYTFVGRYLADQNSWKRLSPSEAQVLSDVGLYIISFFERYTDRVREGSIAGKEDGKLALQYAKEVKQTEGSTIYFCVDYDAQPNDYNAIEAYLRAADKEIDGYELGVYGSYAVVKEMYERGVCKKLAQTVAWSRGKRYENACFYQAQIDTLVNGMNVDLDETNGDAGGWKIGMAAQKQYTLDADVANTIINTWMSPAWFDSQDENQRDYIKWLANQLRAASGQDAQ
ncbi:hypothetical protein GCM10023310_72100 [Paenibacillus vulneris]|uniref:DUF1906 domain-containing protein n=1 Tax=Paenibacillus vulneris TaxID=1133364 RepID=A0ABW3UFF8_9BACL